PRPMHCIRMLVWLETSRGTSMGRPPTEGFTAAERFSNWIRTEHSLFCTTSLEEQTEVFLSRELFATHLAIYMVLRCTVATPSAAAGWCTRLLLRVSCHALVNSWKEF